MTLTLSIQNIDSLDNGEPTQLKLDRHGAIIGRSPHSDWSLPDPKNYISSTHCEIDYRDGQYLLLDRSTNGTFVNGGTERLTEPRPLVDGDVINIGHYKIQVRTAAAGPAASAAPAPAAPGGWGGWGDTPSSTPQAAVDDPWAAAATSGAAPVRAAPPAPTASGWSPAPEAAPPTPRSPAPMPAQDGWGSAAAASAPAASGWEAVSTAGDVSGAWETGPASAVSGRGPMSQNWSAPAVETPVSTSAWGGGGSEAAAGDPGDVWAKFASSHTVDWAGSFDEPAPAPAPPPPPAPIAAAATPAAPTPAPSAASDAAWRAFLAAAGLTADQLKGAPEEAAATAGGLLRRLVSGLVVMIEARARAKAQLGAASTTLELNGNNPIKFARAPDKVLIQLVNPPERGFMAPDLAIEDSFQDLQAHQMATLAAMQGALRSTIERFSPEAIKARAETRGLLARILPSARNAALWDAYQKEFDGVARGSDEAFLDVFSKAFREAYDRASGEMKRNKL